MSVITIPKPLRDKLGEEATEAFVDVIREIDLESKSGLATREDILKLDKDIIKLDNKIEENILKLDNKIDRIKSDIESELKVLKWMMGVVLGGIVSLILKAFFIL